MNQRTRQSKEETAAIWHGEVFELRGRLCSGLGEGSTFTQVDWVLAQFAGKLGLRPYPGTFNLIMEDVASWQRVRTQISTAGGIRITPPDGFCSADCFPVRVNDGPEGFLVLPQVADYPVDKFEIVAAVALREALQLADGDQVEVVLRLP